MGRCGYWCVTLIFHIRLVWLSHWVAIFTHVAMCYLKDSLILQFKWAAHRGMRLCLYNLQTFWMLRRGFGNLLITLVILPRWFRPLHVLEIEWLVQKEKNWTHLWLWKRKRRVILADALVFNSLNTFSPHSSLRGIWRWFRKKARVLQQFSSSSSLTLSLTSFLLVLVHQSRSTLLFSCMETLTIYDTIPVITYWSSFFILQGSRDLYDMSLA